MKIVMLERQVLGMDLDMSGFSKFGELVEYPLSTGDQVAERARDADCIIVNKLKMDKEHLEDCRNLKLILEAATGTDNIDMEYCRSRGITVKNAVGYSTSTVAQHTFAMYFYLSEHLPHYDSFVKSGAYSAQPLFSNFDNFFHDIEGKTWGIIGLGNIGRRVAGIASAFGAKVICGSPTGRKYSSDWEQVDPGTLIERSDVISLHTPLNESTRGLFDYGTFGRMKNSAILINVARGPIVKNADLARALDEGLIAAAGIDVLEKEPMDAADPLLSLKHPERLLITPHMAWGSVEARQRLVDIIQSNLREYIQTGA